MATKNTEASHQPSNSASELATEATSTPQALLSLPASSDSQATKSTSQTFKLDALGPMVINSDGTLSRIHNWAEMSEVERQRTLRILGRRNQLRKENLLAAELRGENDSRSGNSGS